MSVATFLISVFRPIILGSRITLDYASNLFFGIVYRKRTDKIESVKDPILLASAASLAEKIRKRQLRSTRVISAYISRIEQIQPVLNVVAENRFESALEDARKADELIDSQMYTEEELKENFPLLGVPFSCKEALAVKGMRQTCGVFDRRDYVAPENCEAVELLRKAGAIPIVTTNVAEFCANWETFNKIYGRSRNPYNIKRSVGGSSGGEGGLLGAGGSVIGLGSDLGGSIRIPALFNGIFGHKPSKGLISNEGLYLEFLIPYEDYFVVGPMTRYSSDLPLMMKIMAKEGATKLKFDEKVDLSKIRVHYMRHDGGGNPLCTPISKEMKDAQQKVLKYFEETLNIKPQKLHQAELSHSFKIWLNVLNSAKPLKMNSKLQGNYLTTKELCKWVFKRSNFTLITILRSFFSCDATADEKYIHLANKLKEDFENILKDDGIFLYPTLPETAIYHNESMLKMYNIGYSAIFNALGFPVTQCPLDLSSEGLPLGIQIVSGINQDHLTIAVAMELERVFGGWRNPNSSHNNIESI